MISLHFEITSGGRIKFIKKPNDTVLYFYGDKGKVNRRARKASTIRAIGEALINIADKAKEINKYK